MTAYAVGWAVPHARASASWPDRPVTLLVPFPSGGGTDAFARPLAAMLTRGLGQQVLVDNRGGAGGTVGAALSAKAAPNGYTLFVGGVHHAIAPSVYRHLSYDIESDFAPVALLCKVPQVLVVANHDPATDLRSFLDILRARPGEISFASAGNGTSHHLAAELFQLQTNTHMIHIPYRGAGPALQDLVAGQVDAMFDGLGSSAQHIRSGRVRALALAASTRAAAAPGVPTFAEAGLAGYQVTTWYGLWAVRGTPAPVLERLQAELAKAFATPELRDTWLQLGSEVPSVYGSEFSSFVSAEIRRWADVVRRSGVRLD